MRPVKLAIVGCGRITEDSHLRAALKSAAIDIAALVDTDLSRAAILRRMYGISCEVVPSVEAVIEKVEGVLIATPNRTHAAIARVVLGRGIPVLVEKPLATCHEDAVELSELARTKGTFISVGFMTRHYAVVKLVKRLLAQGFLGQPRDFHFEYGTRGGWAPHSGYNLSRQQSGGGVLVVSGTHFLDRMLFWFGYPRRFQYSDDSYGGVEANCKASLEYDGGLRGTLFFSKTIDLAQRFVMNTDRYRVEIPWSERDRLRLWQSELPGVEMTLAEGISGDQDCFQVQIDEFARVIRMGGEPTVSGDEGAESVRLCEEFYANRTQIEEPWTRYPKSQVAVT